jgi:hypothetical protein
VADNQLERCYKDSEEANDFENNKIMFKRWLDNPLTILIFEALRELDEQKQKQTFLIITLKRI